jgi:hypothetical protein
MKMRDEELQRLKIEVAHKKELDAQVRRQNLSEVRN